ncbi:MAG: type I pantothenate kinase [Pseudomonadota bacterium]
MALVVENIIKQDDLEFSPYKTFSRAEWACLRADTPMTLDEGDLEKLSGLTEQVSMDEVVTIYLALSRLLNLYVEGSQALHLATSQFLSQNDHKVPFIIGIGGSVSAGKSTTARVLQALLARWPSHPRVDLVPTDGFLYPNSVLQSRDLMTKKGFPQSFDRHTLLRFLADIKAGKRYVEAPVYSHFHYDIVPDETIVVDQPDILIVEGLNVLQPARLPKDGKEIPFVSDFFDFSIYIDADIDLLEQWYVARFLRLRETAFRDPKAYFHRYSKLINADAIETASDIWNEINLPNLKKNILPTRQRASLILKKGAFHNAVSVDLRKL